MKGKPQSAAQAKKSCARRPELIPISIFEDSECSPDFGFTIFGELDADWLSKFWT